MSLQNTPCVRSACIRQNLPKISEDTEDQPVLYLEELQEGSLTDLGPAQSKFHRKCVVKQVHEAKCLKEIKDSIAPRGNRRSGFKGKAMHAEPWRDIVMCKCLREIPLLNRKMDGFERWCEENMPAYLPFLFKAGGTLKFDLHDRTKDTTPIILCDCNPRITAGDISAMSFRPCRFGSTNSAPAVHTNPCPSPQSCWCAARRDVVPSRHRRVPRCLARRGRGDNSCC